MNRLIPYLQFQGHVLVQDDKSQLRGEESVFPANTFIFKILPS